MHPLFLQFRVSLPNHTKTLLQDPTSPQSLAWQWLTANDDNLNWDVGKLRQRFALASFRFATSVFESDVANQFVSLFVDECNWKGIVCNASGSVTQIALPNSDLTGSAPRELYFCLSCLH